MAAGAMRAVLVAAAMLLLPPVALAQPARIAFQSGDAIALIAADGSGRTTLVHEPRSYASAPAWSPDGQRLALSLGPLEAGSRIYTVRADGSALTPLTARHRESTYDFFPAWSPDGSRVAFTRWHFGRSTLTSSIAVIGADGSGERVVVSERHKALNGLGDATWSPDGARLVYSRPPGDRARDPRPSLWSVGADGSDRRLLLRSASKAAFSSDGARIAYESVTDRVGKSCGETAAASSPRST